MTPDAAEAFLKLLGSLAVNRATLPWVTGNCPLAKWEHESGLDAHPSFGVLTGNVSPRCHCFSCGFSGSPDRLIGEILLRSGGKTGLDLRALEDLLEAQNDTFLIDLSVASDETKAKLPPTPFPEAFWGSFPSAVNCKPAMMYLATRSYFASDVERFDVRYDPHQKRVCLPIRGADQKLYGIRGRSIEPGKLPKVYLYPVGGVTNPQVWFGEDQVDWDEPIVVAESLFDRMAVSRFWGNAIAPCAASLYDEQIARLNKGFIFVHLFDADKAGRRASKRLREGLPKAKHVVLDLPDGEDPDSLPQAQLKLLLQTVLPVG